MKGLFVLILIIGGMVAYTQLDRYLGPRVREVYDRNERWLFPAGFVGAFGLCALLSFVLDAPKLELGILVGVYALLAMGLNVVVGYAGLLDLGYVAFFAIGAYTEGIFSGAGPLKFAHLNFWEILPIGIGIALLAGVILGAPTLRLRGDYLAIVTLGFGEIVRIVAENLEKVTNGAKGITAIPPIAVFGKSFSVFPKPYYLLLIGFISLFVLILRALNHSRVGRAWAAIREDEVAAEAMGVPTLKYKLWAFAIGASTASVGGMVLSARQGFIAPESFVLVISIFILASVVLGGLGSTAGALTGAAVIIVVPEMLRSLKSLPFGDRVLDARFGIFGLALVIMMIFRPQGIVPSRRRAAELKGGSAETHGAIGAGLPVEAEIAAGGKDTEGGPGDS